MEPRAVRSGAGEGHPAQAEIESFMRGELPKERAAAVVRHLLRDCIRCSARTARLWSFGEETLGGEGGMETIPLATARRQLLKVVEELETHQLTLQGIEGNLPAAAAESDRLADVEEMEPVTELRAVISCVRNDHLGPAARDLRDVLAGTWKDLPPGDESPG